jgi:hypothetical protein
MINSILNYILKREGYRKYTELRNLNSRDKSNLFNSLGTFAWLFMWSVFCISTMFNVNFIWGLSLFFVPISFIRLISSFFSARKKTRPIYSDVPITKSDRRYKSGYRIEGYKQVVSSYVALTEDEINIRKNHFKGRMYFWCFIFLVSLATFSYNYSKTPLSSISKSSNTTPWDKLKVGDSVYVTKEEITNELSRIIIYQLARPINKSDIELLKIAEWKKRQLIDKLDTTLTKELIEAFDYNSDYFYKNNSSLIGIYVAKDSTLGVSEESETKWIEVLPTNKRKEFKSVLYEVKEGYMFENRYFIKENQISMTDYMKNKNKKKN